MPCSPGLANGFESAGCCSWPTGQSPAEVEGRIAEPRQGSDFCTCSMLLNRNVDAPNQLRDMKRPDVERRAVCADHTS